MNIIDANISNYEASFILESDNGDQYHVVAEFRVSCFESCVRDLDVIFVDDEGYRVEITDKKVIADVENKVIAALDKHIQDDLVNYLEDQAADYADRRG